MDVLILTSLARRPMHGYEIKLELRYKHVEWWAKCAHGHLYAALKRLERRGAIRQQPAPASGRDRRVFEITSQGRQRMLELLESVGRGPDATYFDVDLFLAGAFAFERSRVLELLAERGASLDRQLGEALVLDGKIGAFVPTAARLIMDHRLEHLRREIAFVQRAREALAADPAWGPYLKDEPIERFVERTGVPLEPNGKGGTGD